VSADPARRREPGGRVTTFLGLFTEVIDRRTLAVLAAAALFAGVGATGGWEGAQARGVVHDSVTAGERVTADPLTVTVKKAFAADAIPTLAPARAGSRFILVTLTVQNTSPRPVDALTAAASFRLETPGLLRAGHPVSSEAAPPQVIRTLDATALGALQPGVEQNLALLWEQADSGAAPAEVTVAVLGHTWRTSSLDGSSRWFDPVTTATVTLPLAPLPAS